MEPVIVARDLFKCYPGFPPVLRGVNIQVEPGELVAIMGPSGCGKSTMLHILGMLHAPDAGSLRILGANVLDLNREQVAAFRRGNMGFVMQSSNLFEHSTVFENVEFPLIYENVPPQERWERVIRALDLVQLSARVHYHSNRLSGGEQQRVAIARAMVNNPRILLADEPTGALDARTSRLIMENFRLLCHSGGVSMVMVTHDPKMAEYCDSIYTLEEGILHCKKHEVVQLVVAEGENPLKPPAPLVRSALLARRFPETHSHAVLLLAKRLHGQRLLGRIYAIFRQSLLANPEGYSLPLAIRQMGFWQKVSCLFHPGTSGVEGEKSRNFPGQDTKPSDKKWPGLKMAIRARILAKWVKEDNIQFIYAIGATDVASLAWFVANALGIPFAFAARGDEVVGKAGPDWGAKAAAAAFVSCSTEALRQAVLELLPDLPPEKIILLRNEPVALPNVEEAAVDAPVQRGKPLEILAGRPESRHVFARILDACVFLKRLGINYQLSIPVSGTIGRRWSVWKRGLKKYVRFLGTPDPASIGEIYRLADIYALIAPADPGGRLLIPEGLVEAMAFGLGIVVSGNTPGIAEILKDGGNALLAPEGDQAKFKTSLETLARDDDLRNSLGEKARKDIKLLLDTDGETRNMADRVVVAAAEADRVRAPSSETEKPPMV